jgi:hypothetical protein
MVIKYWCSVQACTLWEDSNLTCIQCFFYPARTMTILPSVRAMWIRQCEHANSESLLWCFIGDLYRLSYSLTVDLQIFYFEWAAIYMTAGFGIVVPCHASPNKGCASSLGMLWSPSIAALTLLFRLNRQSCITHPPCWSRTLVEVMCHSGLCWTSKWSHRPQIA